VRFGPSVSRIELRGAAALETFLDV
jgi:hypothetical protein